MREASPEMAFKRSSSVEVTTMVFEYHAMPPTSNMDVVREQMSLAHRYYNDLIAIERRRREERDALTMTVSPDLARIEAELAEIESKIDAFVAGVKANRVVSRSKDKLTKSETAELKILKAGRKPLWDARKEARRLVFGGGDAKDEFLLIEHDASVAKKRARAKCGVYWGTYLLTEAAVKDAIDDSIKIGAMPKFKRWDREGAVQVQVESQPSGGIGGGIDTSRLVDGNSRVKLTPLVRHEIATSRRSELRNRAILTLRVGGKDEPVSAQIPILMHRPLPPNARVTWAKLLLRRVGLTERWRVQFTVSFPKPAALPHTVGGVALDLNWRSVAGEGLRVSVGDDGSKLFVPQSLVNAFLKVDEIQSERDLLFNVARERLTGWLKTAEVPDWMSEATSHIHSWRSQDRMRALCCRWRDNRFSSDEDIFNLTSFWLNRECHLYQYESHLRDQAMARRTDIYRNYAIRLCERYSVIAIEKFDLSEVAKIGEVDNENPLHQTARRMRHIACVSSLRGAIEQAAKKTGSEIREVDAANTTSTCSKCGTHNQFDRLRLKFECRCCGTVWDQDANAAINIASRAEVCAVA